MPSRVDGCSLLLLHEVRANASRRRHEEARMQETRRITLLDLEALFDLWTRYYDELAEGDRKLLPLEPVFFLSPED